MPDPLAIGPPPGPNGGPDLCTRAALARELGVSHERVRQYIRRGLPVRLDNKLSRAAALQWVRENVAADLRPERPPPGRPAATDAVPALGAGATYGDARRELEILKAHRMRLEVDRLRGRLLDRAQVVAQVYEEGRRYRDAWLAWPARVSALLAARLGIDPLDMQAALDAEVRAHLAGLAEITLGARPVMGTAAAGPPQQQKED